MAHTLHASTVDEKEFSTSNIFMKIQNPRMLEDSKSFQRKRERIASDLSLSHWKLKNNRAIPSQLRLNQFQPRILISATPLTKWEFHTYLVSNTLPSMYLFSGNY